MENLKTEKKKDELLDVYYHTNDTRFIAHASTYLKDKAFLNEYMD